MSDTTSVRTKNMKTTSLGRSRTAVRAGALLSVIAAVAWSLSLLGRIHPQTPLLQSIRDGTGNEVWFLFDGAGAGDRLPRAVISRVPVEVDRSGSILDFPGGTSRVLPLGGTILVHPDRRLEALGPHLPPLCVLRLLKTPPGDGETLADWFQKPLNHKDLEAAGIPLDRFWK